MIKVEKYFLNFGLLVLVSLSILLFYVSFFGFDLSDESFYVVGYYFKIEPKLANIFFHRIYNFFFGDFNFSIPQMRILRLILTLISSSVLSFSVIRFYTLRIKPLEKLEIKVLYLLMGVSALLSFSWAPMTISYNSLSQVLLLLIASLWFLIHSKIKLNPIINFIMGLIIGITFYNKVTNFILLLLVLPTFSFTWLYITSINFTKALKLFIIQYALIFIGILSSLLFFMNHEITFSENVDELLYGLTNTDENHSLGNLMDTYYESISDLIGNVLIWILISIGIKLLVNYLIRKFNFYKIKWFRGVFYSIYILIIIISENYFLGGSQVVYSIFEIHFLLFLFVIVFDFNGIKKILRNKELVLFCLFSISFLFIGSIGTNNGLTAQFLFYMNFFYLVVFVFLKDSIEEIKYPMLTLIFSLIISQISFATIQYPYRQASLDKCNSKLESNIGLRSLYLEEDLVHLITELEIINEYKIESLFTYNYNLGLSIALDIKPYSFGWISDTKLDLSCDLIRNAENVEVSKLAFIVPDRVKIVSKIDDCLKSKGVNFYSDFQLKKQIEYYNYDLSKSDTLNLYLHRSLIKPISQ